MDTSILLNDGKRAYQFVDINGDTVFVEVDQIKETALNNIVTLYGMSLETIRLLRYMYLNMGGKLPIDEKNVKDLINYK